MMNVVTPLAEYATIGWHKSHKEKKNINMPENERMVKLWKAKKFYKKKEQNIAKQPV